ncbi:hypothetical protein M9H77_22853 [Catharanthus roseus]|uniref:Uncharacterized protein n=1 Tax=Catharanthus roseus TaxID=4058 RepID=A0ACC0ATD4_CATRO|nr:hypothetical protein M9H77_22853 [Catharanthus roseus]
MSAYFYNWGNLISKQKGRNEGDLESKDPTPISLTAAFWSSLNCVTQQHVLQRLPCLILAVGIAPHLHRGLVHVLIRLLVLLTIPAYCHVCFLAADQNIYNKVLNPILASAQDQCNTEGKEEPICRSWFFSLGSCYCFGIFLLQPSSCCFLLLLQLLLFSFAAADWFLPCNCFSLPSASAAIDFSALFTALAASDPKWFCSFFCGC